MKNPQEDDAVERMLNQLEGLLKRQHDSARASRSGLVPLEEQLGAQPAGENSPQNGGGETPTGPQHHVGAEGVSATGGAGEGHEIRSAGANGSGLGSSKAAIELEEYDPDATAPEINAFSQASRDVDLEDRDADVRDQDADGPEAAANGTDRDQAETTGTDESGEPPKLAALPTPTEPEPSTVRTPTEPSSAEPQAQQTPPEPSAVETQAQQTPPEPSAVETQAQQTPPEPSPVETSSRRTPTEPSSAEPSDGAHMTRRLTTRLGQLLLDSHLLSEAQLNKALEQQRDTGERLGSILVTGGYIDETALLSVLSKQHGVPTANLDDRVVDPALTQMIPADMARRYQLIPMAIGKDAVDVAMVDPTDFVAMAHVRFATGLRPNVFITTTTAADRAMARLYAGAEAEPEAADERPRDPRAEIKKMILDRDALLIAADQDPRKFYELAASIDAFVEEIIRKAAG